MPRLIPDETWAVLTLWMECRGEPRDGQLAVAEVIRNRMQRHYQSDGTVVGTVLRQYQFSCWNTTDPQRLHAAILDDGDPHIVAAREVWHDALNGSNVARGAVLYLNPAVLQKRPEWIAESRKVATIGHHDFYVQG